MRYIWMVLITILIAAMLSACQAVHLSTQVSTESPVETQDLGSLPAGNATATLAPTVPQEDTTMVPATPPNEAAEKMVVLVKQHLAKRLGSGVEQIVLSEIKPVVWRDAGLGCPKPGVDYIQVETPGYSILLEAGGMTYRYHTDAAKRFVPCNK